ncbi:MAG: oligosaccharide flippase family protein [Armatimonadota bacterium]
MNRPGGSSRHFVRTLATQLASWTMTFLVVRYVPAYLRGSGYDALGIASAFAAAFAQLVGLGINSVLVREIARDRTRLVALVLSAAAARLPLTVAAFLLGTGIAVGLGYAPPQILLVMLAFAMLPFVQIYEILINALQGLEDFKSGNTALLLERSVFALLQVGLVLLRAPLWCFALTGLASALVCCAYAGMAVRRHVAANPEIVGVARFDRDTVASLVRAGLPLMVGLVFFGLWEPINKILLSKIAGELPVGWFELAKRLGGTAMFLPSALATVMLPVLSREFLADAATFHATTRQLFRAMVLCAAPIAAVLVFGSGRIIALLGYPPEFHGTVPVLQVLGAGITLWFLSQAAAFTLLAMERQSVVGRIGLQLGAVALPVCALGIWLGHRLPMVRNGAVGAMAADIALEAWMLLGYLRALPRDVVRLGDIGLVVRTSVAALPVAAAIAWIPSLRHAWVVLPALLIYALLCLVLRCVDPADIGTVKRLAAGRLRPRANTA